MTMIIMIMSHHYDVDHHYDADADDHYDADDQDLARHHLDPGSPPPNLSDQLQILRSSALLIQHYSDVCQHHSNGCQHHS